MKILRTLTAIMLTIPFLASPFAGLAADKTAEKTADKKQPIKPYTLKYCVVSGDKLGGMGKPYVFTNDNREIKLCCDGCLKDFKKDPAKFIKKIEEGEKKAEADKKASDAHKPN